MLSVFRVLFLTLIFPLFNSTAR